MPEDQDLMAQIATLGAELQRRANRSRRVNGYYEGDCPFPKAVIRAKMTDAYRLLMPMAEAPWGSLVVDSVQDRLEVAGIRTGDRATDEAAWNVWQDNGMDAESSLGHNSALINGRAFATVWPDADGKPEIILDGAEQMIVQYREGSRRHRVAALRHWLDDDHIPHATLYRPDGIYKYRGPKGSTGFQGTQWERREVPGEQWPLENPRGVVPVVELAVNRRLKAGTFGHARGEFEHCLGLIDRINLLTFLGLVVALWMGFPLRGVIGDRIAREILKDDDGNPIIDTATGQPVEVDLPPFDADADRVFQLENPNAKLAEFAAADRKNLSVFAELDQLAVITKTPRHYFPLEQGMSNISADAIRASEGGLHAKVTGHKASLGEGWEEVLRLACAIDGTELPASAAMVWSDHESRSMAERADAAVKLNEILPWQALAEKVLNASQEEVRRWQAMRDDDVLGQLIAAASTPPPVPA